MITMVNYTPPIERDKAPRQREKDEHFTSSYNIINRVIKESLPLHADMDIQQAGEFFIKHQITGLPVVDEHECLVGFLSQKDCLKYSLDAKYYNHASSKVEHYMSENVVTIPKESTLTFIVELFLHYPYHTFPVIENGQVIGIVERTTVFEVIHNMKGTNW
ncbi:CBS domain-containing protein [Halobacteriovorax vibrionivorans]|uniref:CBS domain-containing protein n=2 Tax=Halobacteriovorax TaxID=1652133 RepID=A0ABY0IE86_9BACT|nr:CBS domain-containing protein [Halobacteriovorax vibrionivorans]RZF21276.1 CBS domain-containing protein [Halobacteriovorax vibrionivorans]TGD47966.1 CBS domain-containing protein [Halobacteriovorax sp. Y22]